MTHQGNGNPPNRRELLQRSAMVAGGLALSGLPGCSGEQTASTSPELAGRLAAVTTRGAQLRPGHFLTSGEAGLVRALSDIVMPATDTPGAVGAGVPELIDEMMDEWASDETQAEWRAELAAIDLAAIEADGMPFTALAAERQFAFLTEWDAARLHDNETGWRAIKGMILDGYYRSEIGATQELRFELAPGAYHGCLPFEAVGRTWAE